jgi:hypothetical protein
MAEREFTPREDFHAGKIRTVLREQALAGPAKIPFYENMVPTRKSLTADEFWHNIN